MTSSGHHADFGQGDTWAVFHAPLVTNADGTILSTKTAGGFVGTLFAMHAYAAP